MSTMSAAATLLLLLLGTIACLPQNYDDIDMSLDQPKNEKVKIRSCFHYNDLLLC